MVRASVSKANIRKPAPRYVFTERGWHPGGLNVSEGVDFTRAIAGERYKLIYNAQSGQPYSPIDQGGRLIARDLKKPKGRDADPKPALARTDEEATATDLRTL